VRSGNAHGPRTRLSAARSCWSVFTQRANTTCHCAEEQIPDSYQLSKDVIKGLVIVDGREMVVPSRLHVWGNHPDFSLFNPELERHGYLTPWEAWERRHALSGRSRIAFTGT